MNPRQLSGVFLCPKISLSYAKQIVETGIRSLSEADLINVIMGELGVGEKLLTRIEGLDNLGKLSPEGIEALGVIDVEEGSKLMAAIELGKRKAQSFKVQRDKISSSRDVFNRLSSALGDLMHEEFWVLYLKRSNEVIAQIRISSGGLTGTVADPKIIFSKALALNAAAMILVHNHPSGNNRPSTSDINLTNNLRDAGKFLDLPILDHIIIAGKTYFSFADSGRI